MKQLVASNPGSEAASTAVASPRATAGYRKVWREARIFEAKAQYAFREHASFTQWLLLECLQELLEETGDAVSQVAIAERAGLPKSLVSYWMALMDEEGLVSRGPALDGRAYRIWMGERGERVRRRCAEELAEAGLI